MATIKHISSKNADYGAAEAYLTFEHDEFTMKPTLDEAGRLIPRQDYRLDTLNCGDEDFALSCIRANLRYGKNSKREDIKSHHYIISFDPRDAADNGLTVDRAQMLGLAYCKEHFPGHQALVCTHPDGHNHSGNIHVHTLLELINASEAREDDEEYQSPVDLLFADLEERDPDHFAVKQYRKYKLAAGKTAKSILISCGARLAPFDIKELRDLMSYDELELDTLGDRKSALFLIMSDTDSTFNFVIAMLQSQLFNLLCDKADDEYNGKLPVHVRFLLDEFANIGQIPRFDKLIATIRSREMSASIILQSQSQLKAIYKDAAEIILDNADSTLFLGGRGKNAKDISDNLGRETIDSFNTSENRGTQVSHGLTYQKLGKELMTQDEIAVMDGGKCILQLRGVRPFLSDKYDITKHPNYKYLSDFDKKNAFDVERYMSTRPAIVKPDEAFDIYEIDLSDEDAAAEE